MTDQAYVVDTGVFVRWYVDQDGFEHAREVRDGFLEGAVQLSTTDLARVELAEVLRKKGLLLGRLDPGEYLSAVRDIDDLGVTVRPTEADVLVRAAALAARLRLRVFDALFVDLALSSGTTLLTTDLRLMRAVSGVVSTELLRGVAGPGAAP